MRPFTVSDLKLLTVGIEQLSGAMRTLTAAADRGADGFRLLTAQIEKMEQEWLGRQPDHVRAEYHRLRADGEYMFDAMAKATYAH